MDRVVHGVRREQVDAEQHAVRVLQEQPPRRARLAAQLRDPRRDVHVEVRVRGQHPPHPCEVLGETSDVRADERRGRMRGDDRLERIDQPLEPREPWIGERPLRMGEQLLEPFVPRIHRLEERHRIRDVDHDRQPELAGGIPHVGEPRVVGEQPLAVLVADREPEVLPDLDAARARICGRPQLPHDPLRPAGLRTPGRGRDDRTSRTGPDARGRTDRCSPRSSSPHRPSRFTIASTLAESMSASSAPTSRTDHPPSGVSQRPRWLCASTTGNRARGTRCRGSRTDARPVRTQRQVVQRRVERRGLQTGRSHGVTRW